MRSSKNVPTSLSQSMPHSPFVPRHPVLLLVLLIGLTGCLPYSCRRDPPRALLPADSVSRAAAAAVPVDTLTVAWTTRGTEEHQLTYPRTVLFAGHQLLVSDAERNRIYVVGTDRSFRDAWSQGELDVPYLAGVRGDTIITYNAGANRIDFIVDGRRARTLSIPEELPEDALRYVGATPSAIYLKVLRTSDESRVVHLDAAGRITERYSLPGPYWRHAGLLRAWGDTLMSLSGYRPVVDILPPGSTRFDTLGLRGFDSPMLARTRQFVLGDSHEPPLLTASAAPAGDCLFVLNMRPGWLRVDVFDREGHLQRRLVEPDPRQRAGSDFYPVDLAVRRTARGAYEIAVVSTEPEPRLTLYRWQPR